MLLEEPTNQPTRDLTEGEDLRESKCWRPLTSLAIPMLTTLLGLEADTVNYN